jgi:CubicO group peptidase (beta-lactamase class C family)
VHSSGLVNYTEIADFKDDYEKDEAMDYVIGLFKDEPLQFKPGTKVEYSNSNYYLLGVIIESVTHRPYAEFMKDEIFQPIGMTSTTIEINGGLTPNLASGHTRKEKVRPINPYLTFAAGALITNVDDLARWNSAIDKGLLLGKKGWKKIFTPYELQDGQQANVSYGWGVNELHDAKLYGHEGRTYGYSAIMMRFPNEHLFVAVLSNDDRSHIASLIDSWFHRTDPLCLAAQLATISLSQDEPGFIEANAR